MTDDPMKLLEEARFILSRYRKETPLGNQPHMIAEVATDLLSRIDRCLATGGWISVKDGLPDASERLRSELVGVIDFAIDADEGIEFLRNWREGDTSEWPEYAALAREGSPR